MDILFLGTSSGTPTRERNVTGLALMVENGSGWYLVDCGEGTQHQLLRTPLSLNGLKGIFITHVHGDHCYGLPGLLASAAMSGRKNPLTIFAPQGIEAWIQSTQKLTELFIPFDLQFVATETLNTWKDTDISVTAIQLSHRVPSYAYSFTELIKEASLDTEKLLREGIPQGPIWGRLKSGQTITYEGRDLLSADYVYFSGKARRIIVGGDNDQPGLLREQASQAQVLIHEATYTQEIAAKVGENVQHSCAARVAAFAESIKLPNLVLTHFSPRYQADVNKSPSIADIRAEAAALYQGRLFLAEDFIRYRLNKNAELKQVL